MQLGRRTRREQGDTIIEVVFAIVIFSFVAISSLAIMNQGVATSEKALEITLVRQQVNAQAEALRYIHESLVVNPSLNSKEAKLWNDTIKGAHGQTAASPYGVEGNNCRVPTADGGFKPFIVNARTAEVWNSAPSIAPKAGENYPPYSQVIYNADDSIKAAYGLWVEAVPSLENKDRNEKTFVDFHIRACWPAPGSAIPMTIGTIVRLYDPI